MSALSVEELVEWMDESGQSMAAAAARFGVSKTTVRNLLHTPGEHLRRHPPSKLSDKDAEVLRLIKAFILERGWAPTVRELADIIGQSINPTHNTMHKLAAHGLIEMTGQPRALRVVGSKITMPKEK